jgi:hypothetical protein
VGTVLQDLREGRRGALLDARSVVSAAGGRSPPLALVPKPILEAPELCPGQFGQPPDDLLRPLVALTRHYASEEYVSGRSHKVRCAACIFSLVILAS